MALLFTLLSMLMTSVRDLFEKKSVESKTEDALKTVIWLWDQLSAALLWEV